MATITPSKTKPRGPASKISLSLILLGILVFFGVISLILMHKSKHLHDHDHAKPSLYRENERDGGIDGAHFLALDSMGSEMMSEVSRIHNSHSAHVGKLEELEEKLVNLFKVKTLEDGEPLHDGLRGALKNVDPEPSTYSKLKKNKKVTPITSVTSVTSKAAATAETPKAGEIQQSGPKLHAVTYASHGGRDDRFCRAVESAIRNDFDLVILGWGVKWRGLSQKLEAAQRYAANLDKNDVLLFTDAFDVLFTEKPQVIQQEYNKLDADIVFSAECGCWPHVIEDHGKACFSSYPKSPTPYRYLNSGTWIGKADKAADMLLEVMKEAGSDFANANDQKLVADFYIAGRFGIKLDFYNKIFQSMHMTLDPPLPHCDPTKDVQRTEDGRFMNRLTKSRPAILHFNGGGKRVHLKMEGASWYKAPEHNTKEKKDALRAFLIAAPTEKEPSRRLRFDSICPKYF